jgi:hypothetical protein
VTDHSPNGASRRAAWFVTTGRQLAVAGSKHALALRAHQTTYDREAIERGDRIPAER